MVQFEDFPDEILTMIMEAMCHPPCGILGKGIRRTAVRPFSRALARLASTNRRLHRIATPLLYRRVMFAQSDATSLPYFCRTILTKPEIARLVRAFDFLLMENRACPSDGAEIDETMWMLYDEEEDGEEAEIDYIAYRGWGDATSKEKRTMQDYIRQTFQDEHQQTMWTIRAMDRQLLPALLSLTVARMENLSDLTIRDDETVFWVMFQEFLDAFEADHDRALTPFRNLTSMTAVGLDANVVEGFCFQSLALFLDPSTIGQSWRFDDYGAESDEDEESKDRKIDSRPSGSPLSTLQHLFRWIQRGELRFRGHDSGGYGNPLWNIGDGHRQLESVELVAAGKRSLTATIEGRIKMETFVRHRNHLQSLSLLSAQLKSGQFSLDFSRLCELKSLYISLDWLYQYNLDDVPTRGEWLVQILPPSIQDLYLRLRHHRREMNWLSEALICLLQTKRALHADLKEIVCTVDHDWRMAYPEATREIAEQLSTIHALAWSKEVRMTGPI